MNTVVVWLLVATLSGYKAGGPLVVDNISSRENCEAIAMQLKSQYSRDTNIRRSNSFFYDTHTCIAVRKVK